MTAFGQILHFYRVYYLPLLFLQGVLFTDCFLYSVVDNMYCHLHFKNYRKKLDMIPYVPYKTNYNLVFILYILFAYFKVRLLLLVPDDMNEGMIKKQKKEIFIIDIAHFVRVQDNIDPNQHKFLIRITI